MGRWRWRWRWLRSGAPGGGFGYPDAANGFSPPVNASTADRADDRSVVEVASDAAPQRLLNPDAAPGAVGEAAVLAESADVRPSTAVGTADDCPAAPFPFVPHPEDASLCVLELPACPQSVFDPTTLMRLSMPPPDVLEKFEATPYQDATYEVVDGYDRYPEFCEERIESTSPDYAACQNLTGYTVKDDGSVCRVFYPIRCVAGLHQDGAHTCRAVQRRSWTCADGYLPGNQFRTCFLPVEYPEGATVPACATGAPDFGVFRSAARACEAYVGSDVLRSPGERGCSAYTTGAIPHSRWETGFGLAARTANSYWCQFDAAGLDAGCHDPARSPRCSPSPSLCLKRASRTGGCDQVIETVRCRGHQDAFRRNQLDTAAVREADCTPCPDLPFEPTTCQADDTALPSTRDGDSYGAHRALLRCRLDYPARPMAWPRLFDLDPRRRDPEPCPTTPPSPRDVFCADPPSGAVEWSSSHQSQLAVVNSAVVLRVVDIPIEFRTMRRLQYNNLTGGDGALFVRTDPVAVYGGSSRLDSSVRQLSNVVPGRTYQNLFDMVTGECSLLNPPLFNMKIEELWPGSPDARPAIVELFGAGSLDWWDALPDAEKQRRTEARRVGAALESVVECHESTHSCVWRPQRPGYYRVVGAGAWPTFAVPIERRWGEGSHNSAGTRFLTFSQALDELVENHLRTRGLMQRLYNLAVNRDLHRLQAGDDGRSDGMFVYGDILDVVGMQEGELGSPPRLRAPNPHDGSGGRDDWLYSEHARGLTGCPFPVDLRVNCPGGGVAGNYTETAPVGIIVHEVRTRTVAPVQNR